MIKTALVVDDCELVRRLTCLVLTSAGYRVLEACDGEDALSKLHGQEIALVVSDLNMPNMDGIGLIRALRLLPSYEATPILILSSDAREEKTREGLAAGAAGWLTKPLQRQQMLNSLNSISQLGQS